MATNYLAPSAKQTSQGELKPYFKGWAPSAITLYYALLSYSSQLENEPGINYINKHRVGISSPGRDWTTWGDLEKRFGISHSTLSRARKNLMSGTGDYGLYGQIIWEDLNYIYIRNLSSFDNNLKLIDSSIMRVLSLYVCAHDGDCLIMRLYSVLKMAAKMKVRLSVTQLLAACGRYDIQYKNQVNINRQKIREALSFLSMFKVCDLDMQITLQGKKRCLTFSASHFSAIAGAQMQKIELFFDNGELTQEELSIALSVQQAIDLEV